MLQDLSDEYAICGYLEDVATVSLFIGKSWRILYQVLGKDHYQKLFDFYQNKKKYMHNLIFRNCDLDQITHIIEDYYQQSQEIDHPDLLLNTLLLILKPL